jgi:putative two-component system response regulator
MPGMNGYEVCEVLKSRSETAEVPVIFLSAMSDTLDKVRAFQSGGVDFVTKPFQFDEIKARMETHLKIYSLQKALNEAKETLEAKVEEQVRELAEAQLATITALAKISECRDTDVGRHVERVQRFCKILAQKLREDGEYLPLITQSYISNIEKASLLHDLGKVGIDDGILRKPGKLTEEEFNMMKCHTTIGAQTLRNTLEEYPKNVLLSMGMEIARSHHERWDGTGYPDGTSGEEIPLAARIMALVDVYDALRSKRCYKEAFSHVDTVNIILKSSGTQFDPRIVKVFEKHASIFERVYEDLL